MIRIGIVGYGNLGRACEGLLKSRPEFQHVATFSRRHISNTISLEKINEYKDKVDVLLVCVGSATDTPRLVPKLLESFNTVDSYDVHGDKMKEHLENADSIAKRSGTIAIVGTGWDPGVFSMMRIYMESFFNIDVQTFWGPGVSLGHTNAIRGIDGVENAIQLTIPLPKKNKHKRMCYIVSKKSERSRIVETIVNMPKYFKGQYITIRFVSRKKFNSKFINRTEHGGVVVAKDSQSSAMFKLKLKSNSHFTACTMLSYAIAAYKLKQENQNGAFTVADIAPSYLSLNSVIDKI